MTKDKLIKAKIEDRILQCRDGYYVTSTGFLDSHEQSVAGSLAKHAAGVRTLLYGGYEDAERRMLVCMPADIPMRAEDAVEGLIQVLRVSRPAGSRELTHRDYLGSILGLGIERRLVGDILVRDDGADIFIVPEIGNFLLQEYIQAGRCSVRTELADVADAVIPELRTEMISDTVSSVRLDSVVASAFRISRSKAADAVRKGMVSVDHAECLKPDAGVNEGSAIVLKGKGKAVLAETGGESRKGRIRIKIKKYI